MRVIRFVGDISEVGYDDQTEILTLVADGQELAFHLGTRTKAATPRREARPVPKPQAKPDGTPAPSMSTP